MTTVDLTLAMAYYEHVADLTSGRVPVEGARLRWLELPVEEIFHRFYEYREWEISEMSMGKYISLVSQGDDSMVGLPVFPSRVFRHSAVYVRAGDITAPDQLRGRRLGIPEWAQTAAVYMRGLLTHEWGVPLADVRWFQAGVNQPGRREHVKLALPSGVELTPVPDRSLNDMLLAGDIDAVLSAHPPEAFKSGDPRVARLIPEGSAVEEEYARRTGIVPIMHLIVLRRDLVDRHPWLVGNLMTAFEEARARSVGRWARRTRRPGTAAVGRRGAGAHPGGLRRRAMAVRRGREPHHARGVRPLVGRAGRDTSPGRRRRDVPGLPSHALPDLKAAP